ncbi:unnamed protein product [Closterium sp. NIES-53]
MEFTLQGKAGVVAHFMPRGMLLESLEPPVAGSASSINSASAAPLPAPSAFPASAAIARPAKPDGLGSKAQDSGLVAPVLPPDLSGQPVKEKSLRVKHGLGMDGGAGDWAGKMAEAGGMSKGSVKMLPPTPMFAHLGNVRKAGSGEAHKLPRTERNGAGARSEEGDGAGSGGRSRSGSGRLWVFGGSADGSNGSRRGMGATAAAVVAGAGLVAQARDVCSMHAGRPLAMLSAGDRSTGGGGTMGGGGSMSGRGSTGGPRIKRNLTAAQISQHASALREGRTMCELLRVQQRGKGRHLLIMAHGFGANHAQWKDVVELMSPDRFTVLLFDFIGAHGTQHDLFDPVRYASLKGFADDVSLLLDELGIQASSSWQEITFIGHQQAGIVGLLLALQRPDLFHRVITLASSPRLLSDVGYAGGFELQDLDQVFGVMQSNYTMWAAGCMPVLTPDDIRLPHVCDFTRPLFSLRPDVAFALLKTTFACDVRAVLPEVLVQTHMLLIALDPTVPHSTTQHMLAAIPNSYAEILAVTSLHVRPDVVATSILRHISMPLRDAQSQSCRQTVSTRFAIPSSVLPPTRVVEEGWE